MRKKKNIITLVSVFILLVNFSNKVFAQNHQMAMNMADTINFSPNLQEGWQLFNSYVAYTPKKDSAMLELIIQHGNNIDWAQQQYVGKVKTNSYKPASDRNIDFFIQNRSYALRIDSNGRVWLTYKSAGIPIVNNPNVLIIKVFYKL